MPDLAVVIVTWNVCDLAIQALQSLIDDLKQSSLQAEIYVVDNASSDDTPAAIAEQFPQVKLYALSENVGFGGGNNYALRKMGFGAMGIEEKSELPRAVYLLNSDTITQTGATQRLFDTLMHNAELGLVGARLTYGDGGFQHSAFKFPGLRQIWVEFFATPGRLIEGSFNGRYPSRLYNGQQPFTVDFTLGATMMLKREVIAQAGMFDEAFFMYCEEIDWAQRIQQAGWKVACVPTAHVIHLGGQSTSQVKPRSVLDLWTSRLRLFRRYYPAWKFALARWMVIVGMQRKIHRAREDKTLNAAERMMIIEAYQQVQRLFRIGITE